MQTFSNKTFLFIYKFSRITADVGLNYSRFIRKQLNVPNSFHTCHISNNENLKFIPCLYCKNYTLVAKKFNPIKNDVDNGIY